MSIERLVDSFDKEHLWHPYTSALEPLPAFKVVGAQGRTLELVDGTKLIDAMSSWWCCNLGYQIPKITAALKEQVDILPHVMFAGLTHDKAIELGQRLLKLIPFMEHIFYADSGSVATEVALKMAIQYQRAKGIKSRTNFLTVKSGYHGDTWNAMSVCDPEGMHTVFGGALQERIFAPNPKTPFPGSLVASKTRADKCDLSTDPDAENKMIEQDLKGVAELLAAHKDEIAAIILEPIVQGAGGMYFYHPKFLQGLRKLCDTYDVVLIFDEIATGFGRTGKLFAYEHAATQPDIMLLGKGLTSGYMTLSAVLCQGKISHTISSHAPNVFMHGPTFMANPLACAVACAAVDSLLEFDYQGRVKVIEQGLKEGLGKLINCNCVQEIRVLGAIGVVELKERANVKAIQEQCLSLGVWLRPMGNLLYAMPPLTTIDEELDKIIKAMSRICELIDNGTIPSVNLPKEDNPV